MVSTKVERRRWLSVACGPVDLLLGVVKSVHVALLPRHSQSIEMLKQTVYFFSQDPEGGRKGGCPTGEGGQKSSQGSREREAKVRERGMSCNQAMT